MEKAVKVMYCLLKNIFYSQLMLKIFNKQWKMSKLFKYIAKAIDKQLEQLSRINDRRAKSNG